MPEAEAVEALLETSGALQEGHFLLSSGLHSRRYVQCARLLELPSRARLVGAMLAQLIADLRPDSVLAPAMGGLLIGHEVGAALELPFRFTERQDGEMRLRRGFGLAPGERVAVIEDVVTTGRSTLETAAVVGESGANVVGVGAIIDRTGGAHPFTVPFRALVALSFSTWEPASCPLCVAGGEPEKPGSRARTSS